MDNQPALSQARHNVQAILSSVVMTAILSCCGCGGTSTADSKPAAPPAPPAKNEAIAVLYYDDGTPFCEAFRKGAEAGAEERKVKLQWYDATNADSQVAKLEMATKENHVGLCICPLAVDQFSSQISALKDEGIQVVIAERPLDSEPAGDPDEQIGFASSDHFHAGTVIAGLAAESIDKEGRILIIPGDDFVANERLLGVKYALKDIEEIEFATTDELDNAHGEANDAEDDEEEEDSEEASTPDANRTVAMIVEEYLADTDPESTRIIVLAINDVADAASGREAAGDDYADLGIFSFGSNATTPSDIESGVLTATALEDPFTMGLSSITTVADGLDGNPVAGMISTQTHLVTMENLEEERSVQLMKSNVRK